MNAFLDEYSVGGYEELPPPRLYPRLHREFLRAIVAAKTGISYYRVHLKELDAAYSVAFPNSTPINVSKKSAHSQPAHSQPATVANVEFAPLCGAEATFSGSSEDPSRPKGEEKGEEMEGVEKSKF
ncbi:MAG: hypothetical protein K6G70_09660 [Bacteroidaceae bacterium]|nr:hypothetical protein [Bacteroidaceae bacterium]